MNNNIIDNNNNYNNNTALRIKLILELYPVFINEKSIT